MNARRMTAAIATVAASIALLAGCTPQDGSTTAAGCDPNGVAMFQAAECRGAAPEPVAERKTDGEGGCDPAGFGPLSGCAGDTRSARDSGNGGGNAGFGPDPDVDPEVFADHADHEAGHKAVADEYRWRVREVHLLSDGSGKTILAGWGLPCDCPIKVIAFAVAGEAASPQVPMSGDDRALVDRALRSVPDGDQEAVEDQGRAEAARIVAARSAQIDQDAAELLRDGEL